MTKSQSRSARESCFSALVVGSGRAAAGYARWIRYGYPLVAKGMKAVKRRIRPWMTALLAVFMAVNLVTSALALARYDARTSGAAPANAVDVLLDEHFDNARMERIYPNAKKVEKAG